MNDLFYKISAFLVLAIAVGTGINMHAADASPQKQDSIRRDSESLNREDVPQLVLTAQLPDAQKRSPSQVQSVDRPKKETQKPQENFSIDTFSSGVFLRENWSTPPEISAVSALVADLEPDGDTYFKKSENRRWPLASLTKLMTAVVAKKEIPSTIIMRFIDSDFLLGKNSYTSHLESGDSYMADDIIRIMLVSSSNSAANSLMRTGGGDSFISHMNAQAKNWNLKSTYFTDPAGVHASNQSTASDIVTLARRLYAFYPEIFQTTTASSITIEDVIIGEKKVFHSTNDFAGESYFLGGKTGQTPEAKQNLLSVFSYDGSPVVVVVLGSKSRFEDTKKIFNWFTHDFVASN